jgi:hypothetical protein
MADIISTLKRGGKELAQESAQTDGMCKGGSPGVGGGDTSIFGELKGHGSAEYRQESAKTEGLCKG